eukprot:m.256249 g.256249  ORF g.256249 m.256249 type:complete len:144 (+) comp40400_c1_seq63:1508-1939(+)
MLRRLQRVGSPKTILQFAFDNDGLLLYTGPTIRSDFLSIGVLNGFVEFRFGLGSGSVVIRSGQRIDRSKIHIVKASRRIRRGSLTVDGVTTEGSSPLSFSSLDSGNYFVGGVPASQGVAARRHTGLDNSLAACVLEVQGAFKC